jgi:hypothetical protein
LLLSTGTCYLAWRVYFIFCDRFLDPVVIIVFVISTVLLGFTVFWFLVGFRLCCSCNDVLLGCTVESGFPCHHSKASPLAFWERAPQMWRENESVYISIGQLWRSVYSVWGNTYEEKCIQTLSSKFEREKPFGKPSADIMVGLILNWP